MFDGTAMEAGRMKTTLRMKIVVPSRSGAVEDSSASAPRKGGSTDPKEFLAMRARQKKARQRARRVKFGLLAASCVGMVGLALVSPRFRELALAKRQLQPVAVAVAAPAPVTPAPAPEAVQAAVAAPAEPAAPVEAAPAVEPVAPAEASALSGCHDEFERRQWKSALASCTLAFEAAPDAALALKVAHAHWSRGEIYRSGKWAKKAVELGTDNADAYVLIGHAERKAGHGTEALAAYRRYLADAPYGWHAVRVRAAIRAVKAELNDTN
jgi:hypothetical protein